jgi:hypothetical protein
MNTNNKKKLKPIFEKHFEEIENLRNSKFFSWDLIKEKYNIETTKSNVRNQYLEFRKRKGLITSNNIINNTIIDSFEDLNKGEKKFTFTADNIPTHEEIIKHFKIDTDKYKINQIYHKTSFGGKYAITVSLLSNKESHLHINFKKGFEDFCLKQSLKTLKPNSKINFDTTSKFNKDSTVIINLADLHIGKLVSENETGERYNIDIAKERFLNCIKYLAYKSYQCYGVKKFILSTLGDTLHTDTIKSTTTSGTYVESDTRASKVFEVALEVLTESIDILKQFADEVEFININGNHCELSEQHLGIALKAYYRNDKSICINSEPKVRKTMLIGENLLTWNHGDTNMNTLPLTIATESSELWGKSKFRLVQLGHLHSTKKKVFQAEDEFNGVIVRHFSSLSGTDSWHNKNNFVGNQKRGTALVFSDNEIGIVGEFYKTI